MEGTSARSELVAGTPDWFVPARAGSRDEAALRRLLRETPMPGGIEVSLEREPDFFRAAAIEGSSHHTLIARRPGSGELLGMCSRSVRARFVNGVSRRVGYLSQLRIAPECRGRKRELLRAGFDGLARTREHGEEPFEITTIISSNRAARRLLTAGLPGLPIYQELEPIITFLLPVRGRDGTSGITVRRATPQLQGPILACLERFGRRHQFAPHWREGECCFPAEPGIENFLVITAGSDVRACLALWDQRNYKQSVIRGYHGLLRWLRPWLNLAGARLPSVGSVLPLAYLSHLGVDEDEPRLLEALLRAALRHTRERTDCQWLAVGLAARHPLVETVRRYSVREYTSALYVVHSREQPVALDHRLPHVEVALL